MQQSLRNFYNEETNDSGANLSIMIKKCNGLIEHYIRRGRAFSVVVIAARRLENRLTACPIPRISGLLLTLTAPFVSFSHLDGGIPGPTQNIRRFFVY